MANATLSFNLPEEQVEFDLACRAGDMHSILIGLDNELRSHLRYNSHPDWDDATVEGIRKILNEAMADRCVHIG